MNIKRLNIHNFKEESKRELESLLKNYPYGRFNEDPFLDKQKSSLYTAGIILKDCKEAAQTTLLSLGSEGCVGLICLHKSAWDTELMGFGVAIVKYLIARGHNFDLRVQIYLELLAAAEGWFKKEDIRFVSVRVPGRDLAGVNALCKAGYLYIENWLYNSFDLSNLLPKIDKKYRLRPFIRKKDLEVMLNFSKGAFITQRYHADPYFSPNLAEEVYSKWIRTSVDSKEDYIVALEDSSKTVGFLIYTHKDLSLELGKKFSQWKFAVIDSAQRGTGI